MAEPGDKGGGIDPNTGMSENDMKKGEVQNQVNILCFWFISYTYCFNSNYLF